MPIVVENGTGVSGAESYIDIDFLEEFCGSWGLTLPDPLEIEDAEAALRRGTLIFDQVYGPRFLGGAPLSSSQGLLFPMTGLVSARNYELPVFPVEVQQATAVLARQEAVAPMSMYPTVTSGKIKKKVEAGGTDGRVVIEFDTSANQQVGVLEAARPTLALVEGIVSRIASAVRTSRHQGYSVRG